MAKKICKIKKRLV